MGVIMLVLGLMLGTIFILMAAKLLSLSPEEAVASRLFKEDVATQKAIDSAPKAEGEWHFVTLTQKGARYRSKDGKLFRTKSQLDVYNDALDSFESWVHTKTVKPTLRKDDQDKEERLVEL